MTLTEVLSVFAKKVRTGLISDTEFDRLAARFFADIRDRVFVPIRILNSHFESAGELIAVHGKVRQIHSLDAIQLAVALSIRDPVAMDCFVCADERLCEVARLQGLSVIYPQ